MTDFTLLCDLPANMIRAVGFGFYVTGFLAVVCIVRSFGHPKTGKNIVFCLPILLVSILFANNIHAYSVYSIPGIEFLKDISYDAVFSLPVWVVALVWVLSLAATSALMIRLEARIRRELSAQSVCEGLNQLPDGVCVSLPNGFPRLVNDQMQRISNTAFGVGVLDTVQLDALMEKRAYRPGCRMEEREENRFLLLSDGSVWQMKKQPLHAEGRDMTEMIAYNVTERYHDLLELEQRNARLAAINGQLRDVLSNMNRIVREKEILAARVRLHNDLGQCLLMLENYLQRGGDCEEVLRELSATAEMLWNKQSDEQTDDRLVALLEAAEAVGVKIRMRGELPEAWKETIELAILECLINTVKHAKGKRLDVTFARDGGFYTVSITNDGEPPKGTVRETGGLANLRTLAVRQGAEMTVESKPVFRLILRLDKAGPLPYGVPQSSALSPCREIPQNRKTEQERRI